MNKINYSTTTFILFLTIVTILSACDPNSNDEENSQNNNINENVANQENSQDISEDNINNDEIELSENRSENQMDNLETNPQNVSTNDNVNSSNNNDVNSEVDLCSNITCEDNQMCEDATGTCVEQLDCMAILVCRTRQPEVTCFARSVDPVSMDLANSLSDCMVESGCEDMDCLKNECTNQFNRCKWDVSGLHNLEEVTEGRTYSCQGAWSCIRDCEGAMTCANNCYNKTTIYYQEDIITLANCLANNGCHPDDDWCSREACVWEMDGCRGQLSE